MAKKPSPQKIENVLGDQNMRKNLGYEDPLWFCHIYLRHHLSHPIAPFHREMNHILKDTNYRFIVIMAFRESGKSTIMNMANILWSILGTPQKKFVVIVSQTQDQAKNQFANIKDELISNELLRADFGPFADNENEWKKMSLELEYHGSKIMSISMEQSIRGLKFGMIRPDLVIVDDIEDVSTAQDDNARDRIWQRLTSEILPLGSKGTRVIVLGNLVCPDSILMRLKKYIDQKSINGIFRAYPLLDDARRILWPGKWPNLDSVIEMKDGFTHGVWVREFLLKILGWNHGKDDDSDVYAHIEKNEYDSDRKTEPIIYQEHLISEMKDYAISVPIDRPVRFFSTSDDITYQRYYGNVHIKDPQRSAQEELDSRDFFSKRWHHWFQHHDTMTGDPKSDWATYCKILNNLVSDDDPTGVKKCCGIGE